MGVGGRQDLEREVELESFSGRRTGHCSVQYGFFEALATGRRAVPDVVAAADAQAAEEGRVFLVDGARGGAVAAFETRRRRWRPCRAAAWRFRRARCFPRARVR